MTLVEDKMRRIEGECALFSFNMCPIYTHGGASATFSINSHATDYGVSYKVKGAVRHVGIDLKVPSHQFRSA